MKRVIIHPRLGEITLAKGKHIKRLSVSVRPEARVRLNVPERCSMRAALAFLAEKEEWVRAALDKAARKYPSRLLEPGYSTFNHVLEFIPREDADKPSRHMTDDRIKVTFPATMTYVDSQVQETARAAVITTLRAEAKAVLPGIVAEAAFHYGFSYGRVSVRASRSRWGSCSYRDDISLSIFLMLLPQHLIWYVVVHELCHTRHRDHSPSFHRLLDSLLAGREKELRHELLSYAPGIL